MLIKLRKSKAQTTAEYAILIALVIGAAMAMQIYVKRGLQGRVKDVVDHTGSGGIVGSNTDNLEFSASQYEPYYLRSDAQTGQDTTDSETVTDGGIVGRGTTSNTAANRHQTIVPGDADTGE